MRAGGFLALAQQVKIDRLRAQIARRHVRVHSFRHGHHGPDQAHGRDLFIGAGYGSLFGGVYGALRVGHKIGLRGPQLAAAIGQFRANGDALVGVETGDADGGCFVGHRAGGNNLQRLRADFAASEQSSEYNQR